MLRVAGNYSTFVEKRGEFLQAQAKEREALATLVRREVDWLRRGAKARTRKSKARVGEALRLIGNLTDLDERRSSSTALIEFTSSDRRTKKLIEAEHVSFGYEERLLIRDLGFVLGPGQRLGLAGPNGSGKTTLLKLLKGELAPRSGEIRRAPALKALYFEQARQQIDPGLPLKRALAPEGDSVLYRGRPIHVNGWARRFLFREEQLGQPVGSLSGGERARVHIARLMLQEADLLLLDEPTNDLDIPTLEVLEETLLEFPGALVLVTHDRALMDRVSNAVLGLDGEGGAALYADLAQWEADLDRKRRSAEPARETRPQARNSAPGAVKKKLSYIEQREYDAIEGKIFEADERLAAAERRLQASDVVSDPQKIAEAYAERTPRNTKWTFCTRAGWNWKPDSRPTEDSAARSPRPALRPTTLSQRRYRLQQRRPQFVQVLAHRLHLLAQRCDFALQFVDALSQAGSGGGRNQNRNCLRRFGRRREEVAPARLLRSGRAAHSRGQWLRLARGELVERELHGLEVGEAVQVGGARAQLGRLWLSEQQHRENGQFSTGEVERVRQAVPELQHAAARF